MNDFKIKYHLNNLLLFTLCLFFTSTITAMQITNKEMDKTLNVGILGEEYKPELVVFLKTPDQINIINDLNGLERNLVIKSL